MNKKESNEILFINDIMIVGIIFVLICFLIQSCQFKFQSERIHKLVEVERTAKIEAMKVAIDINNTLEIHREMNLSLNFEIDSLMNELNEFKDLEKLKKDLDRSKQ